MAVSIQPFFDFIVLITSADTSLFLRFEATRLTCKFMKYSIQISDPVTKLESIKIRTALSGHLPYSWKKRCWMLSAML